MNIQGWFPLGLTGLISLQSKGLSRVFSRTTIGKHQFFSLLYGPTLTSIHAAAAAKSLQSCPTLCDPTNGSPPGSPVPGVLQTRTLEWVAISFSNAWKWKWSRSVGSNSSKPHGLQPTELLRPPDFPGKSTGVGCHCLLRSIHDYRKNHTFDHTGPWSAEWCLCTVIGL